MDFESYLISKRIDSARFNQAEPDVWQSWKRDFEQMHPNSFTVQKLNMINPIRRKYQLTITESPKVVATPVVKAPTAPAAKTVMKVPRPGIVIPKAESTKTDSPATSEPVTPASESIKSTATDPVVPATPPDASIADTSVAIPAGSETITDKPQPTSDDMPVSEKPKPARPVIPRPVIKPKPKTN